MGKSHCCKKKINPQYLVVELLAGVLFYLNTVLFSTNQAIVLSGITFFLLIIFYIDLKHQIIFDIFPYLLLASGLLINFYPKFNPFSISMIDSFLSLETFMRNVPDIKTFKQMIPLNTDGFKWSNADRENAKTLWDN